jgi:dihydrofolate reductase
MASYWPTPMAAQNDPVVAEGMNRSRKIVFSRTMKRADWNNTVIIRENVVEEITRLKRKEENDITILGSGSIVSLCAEHGLIDEYQIMIDPVLNGGGGQFCGSIGRQLDLTLTSSRIFKSGVVLLSYHPKVQ